MERCCKDELHVVFLCVEPSQETTESSQQSDDSRGITEVITDKPPPADPQKSTANVKGNRKVVVTTYPTPEAVFKIPDGLDLEDKSVVTGWGTKYDTLYIYYVDGREEKIEWEFDAGEFAAENFKRGDMAIEDADDYDVEYEEEPSPEPTA